MPILSDQSPLHGCSLRELESTHFPPVIQDVGGYESPDNQLIIDTLDLVENFVNRLLQASGVRMEYDFQWVNVRDAVKNPEGKIGHIRLSATRDKGMIQSTPNPSPSHDDPPAKNPLSGSIKS